MDLIGKIGKKRIKREEMMEKGSTLRLKMMPEGGVESEIAVDAGSEYELGRGLNGLSHPSISKLHAVLKNVEGDVYLRDNGSRCGTYVKRLKGEEVELKTGDMFQVGVFDFLVKEVMVEGEKPYVRLEIFEYPQEFIKTMRGIEEMKSEGVVAPCYKLALNSEKFIGRNNYSPSIILEDASVDSQHVALYKKEQKVIAMCISEKG